ncbi:MAG: flagellar biosynthesis protein FlhB [Balneolales bacterium]|nr:flagellar biosynthesis protein FlhB [Balneolales bacterium]
MADQNSDQEKTEEPTAKRLEKAREEGNVASSKEISSVAVLVTAVGMLGATGGMIYDRLRYLFESFFFNSGMGFEDEAQAVSYLATAMYYGMQILLPFCGILVVMILLVNFGQTKGMFSVKAMAFKLEKINPISGIKKILSAKGLMELAKGLAKLGIVGLIGYYSIKDDVGSYATYLIAPIESSMSGMGEDIFGFVIRIFAALLVLSIIDANFQRFQHKKSLRMTKQEIKDEFKSMEGDPKVKAQRKKFGMNLVRQKRMDHAVLASDVVVRNPTHYAVALKYDPERNNAPIVMVKGQRLRALRIIELAEHYGIPIVENKPVARALFATAEEDQFIPEELYKAVAEILAYVFKLKKKA